jgi:hypothetical protein
MSKNKFQSSRLNTRFTSPNKIQRKNTESNKNNTLLLTEPVFDRSRTVPRIRNSLNASSGDMNNLTL